MSEERKTVKIGDYECYPPFDVQQSRRTALWSVYDEIGIRIVGGLIAPVAEHIAAALNAYPEIEALREEVAALRAENEFVWSADSAWMPVSQQLPKVGEVVLWQIDKFTMLIGYLAQGGAKVYRSGGSSYEWLSELQAWRLLPEPYTGESK